jgi:streptomycin 3"-adenylyltransferase
MTPSGDAWERQARRIVDVCTAHLPVLTGVYVHGSAALGGFTDASDLDVLVVGDSAANWAELGRTLLSAATDFPLELSVVAPHDAANPAPPWPFQLHVASPTKVVLSEAGGDPDLCGHYAVTRQAGIPILEVPTEQAVGQILVAYCWPTFMTN